MASESKKATQKRLVNLLHNLGDIWWVSLHPTIKFPKHLELYACKWLEVPPAPKKEQLSVYLLTKSD